MNRRASAGGGATLRAVQWRGSLLLGAVALGLLVFSCRSDDDTTSAAAGSGGSTAGSAGSSGGSGGSSGRGMAGAEPATDGGTAGEPQSGPPAEAGAPAMAGSAAGGQAGSDEATGGEGGSGGESDSGAHLVLQLATGTQFSCALLANGAVKCWGDDSYGTLGNGPPATSREPIASDVVGLGKAKKIAAAGNTVCAIREADAQARCWGLNAYKAIDVDSSITMVTAPAPLKGLGSMPVTDVAVGTDLQRVTSHGCVIDANGIVGCWGKNASYELGITSSTTSGSVVFTPGLGSFISVVAAEAFSCGLTTGHGVKCWGSAAHGELGNDDPTAAPTAVPVGVTGLGSGVKQIAASGETACALTTSGGVKCWGSPAYGAVGASTDLHQYNGVVPSPVNVVGLSTGVAAITGGTMSFCALMEADGSIYCWGYNQNGQLGNQPNPIGVNEYEPLPVQVIGITGATVVSMGWSHACAALASGGVKCWGSGTPSGSDLSTNQIVPTYVRGL